MNTKIILLSLGVAALTSCTTAYKSGQTPDDVYYSPAKEKEAYVDVEQQQDEYPSYNNSSDYYNSYRDDRFLRLGIANHYRWSDYDTYLYMNGFNYGMNQFSYGLYS